jgi:hypothetical protein
MGMIDDSNESPIWQPEVIPSLLGVKIIQVTAAVHCIAVNSYFCAVMRILS